MTVQTQYSNTKQTKYSNTKTGAKILHAQHPHMDKCTIIVVPRYKGKAKPKNEPYCTTHAKWRCDIMKSEKRNHG